ncbi:phage exclusion protein Lit family protein [Thiomonas sp. FB-6]|uniref:phage exclusion protein Lit family protein n=1 Tax=Thiomonas sp. FB-6 TaxID=1158291 RepID=UPI0018C8EDA9|nr:phage exclusion protein Lit family protein [Thiomonas sp. FB-6]
METTDTVRKLFDGVVPERASEIESIVNYYDAQFRLIGDREGFNLDAGGFSAIQYTSRSTRQMWLFGYAGRQALHCYASLIVLFKSRGDTLDINEISRIPDQAAEDETFKSILGSVKDLSTAFHEDDFEWPVGIPEPEKGRPSDAERAAIYDLTCMATAFVFLHELKHIIFSAEGNSPEDPKDEEYCCDEFAKDMMISRINQYATSSGYPEEKVRMKRMMGIALASAFILFATGKGRLAGSETHPPIHGRWSATVKDVNLSDDDWFWLYFSSFALALLKYYSIAIQPKVVNNYKSLCLDLISDLENGI